jgi:tetratricopeptide (TPR) repeat protein
VRPQADGSTRYELLETLREYGRRRLSDAQAAELFAAHASHFAAEAGAIGAELCGPGEGDAMARAEASLADLRAAQRFALELGSLDVTFRLISSIREFAMRAMRYEIFGWADAACNVPGALDHPLAPTLTGMRAYGAWVRGEFRLAIQLAEETRSLERELSVFPSGLAERTLANVLYIVGDARTGHDEALRQIELAEESGDRSRLVHACYLGAVGHSSNGAYNEADALVARAFALAKETASPTDLASAEVARGFASRTENEALEAFSASERIARSAGNRWMQAFAFTEASGLLVSRGELDIGCAGLADMVGVWYRAGDWSQQWHTLSRCVIALDRIGKTDLALELLGAIEKHAMLGVAPMSSILQDLVLETRTQLVDSIGSERAGERLAAGAACPVEDIVLRTRRALIGAS